jgi:hypothetical protein
VHEVWARFFSSSIKDDMRYSPEDGFETFFWPPIVGENGSELGDRGQAFHDARAARMVGANEGLTATHNRMDDPDERDPAILHLRALHDAMDAAVLRAYGIERGASRDRSHASAHRSAVRRRVRRAIAAAAPLLETS